MDELERLGTRAAAIADPTNWVVARLIDRETRRLRKPRIVVFARITQVKSLHVCWQPDTPDEAPPHGGPIGDFWGYGTSDTFGRYSNCLIRVTDARQFTCGSTIQGPSGGEAGETFWEGRDLLDALLLHVLEYLSVFAEVRVEQWLEVTEPDFPLEPTWPECRLLRAYDEGHAQLEGARTFAEARVAEQARFIGVSPEEWGRIALLPAESQLVGLRTASSKRVAAGSFQKLNRLTAELATIRSQMQELETQRASVESSPAYHAGSMEPQ